jgi:hypothetical protein
MATDHDVGEVAKTYTYGLFAPTHPESDTSLQALAVIVRNIACMDESELLEHISRQGIEDFARIQLSDELPIPDLGDWDALEGAPTRPLTDEEFNAYIAARR